METNDNAFYLEEINNLAKNDKDLLVKMSEEMYHEQITDMVNLALKKHTVRIFLLAGPSSSGKTTTSLLLKKELKRRNKKCITVSLDDFFLDREQTPLLPNGNYDYENITAIDLKLFNKFINDLFENNKAYMPKYDFLTGKKELNKTLIECDDNTYIIIEGLHALNPMLLDQPQEKLFKIYICVLSNFCFSDKLLLNYTDLRLMRRCIRDYYTRGRTIDETINGWQEVRDGEELYIDPFKNTVDYKVDSTHMYEPLVYAYDLKDKLEKSTLAKAKELANILSKCEKLNKNVIPKNSLLNEFIQQ